MDPIPHDVATPPARSSLREVAILFLRLGFTAFGGPAAHIAIMEQELVQRRKWLDRQELLNLIAAINFIPGPNSTELAIHIGLIRAGWRGLMLAGACFILPAVCIILPLAWLYVTYGSLPGWQGPLRAIVACIIAIIAAAMWRFLRTAVKNRFTAIVAILSTIAAFAVQRWHIPQGELVILAGAAIAGMLRIKPQPATRDIRKTAALPLLGWKGKWLAVLATAALPGKMLLMFLIFLKIGATLFGSGYVLASYLQYDLVERYHWMTATELTRAIAVGQVTPGPLLTTATFIGYVLTARWGGSAWQAVGGGLLATLGIFLPSFILVAMLGRLWPALSRSPRARGAFEGMNAAVVALIFAVAVALGRTAIVDIRTGAIAAVSLAVLLRWNINSTWLIAAAAVAGWVMW